MTVTVHIERLVLDGVTVEPWAVAELRAAVTAEIGRLLAGGPIPAAFLDGGAVPSLRSPGVVVPPAAGSPGSAAAWGTQIGRAVHRSFGP